MYWALLKNWKECICYACLYMLTDSTIIHVSMYMWLSLIDAFQKILGKRYANFFLTSYLSCVHVLHFQKRCLCQSVYLKLKTHFIYFLQRILRFDFPLYCAARYRPFSSIFVLKFILHIVWTFYANCSGGITPSNLWL